MFIRLLSRNEHGCIHVKSVNASKQQYDRFRYGGISPKRSGSGPKSQYAVKPEVVNTALTMRNGC